MAAAPAFASAATQRSGNVADGLVPANGRLSPPEWLCSGPGTDGRPGLPTIVSLGIDAVDLLHPWAKVGRAVSSRR